MSAVLLCLSVQGWAFADEVTSKYFKANIRGGGDIYRALEKLDIKSLRHPDVALNKGASDAKNILKNTLDTLYLEVSDILDIHMYSFQINLEVLPDKNSLKALLRELYGAGADADSFYFYERNTIYISLERMTPGMLAHETAHAILSRYFAVPAPEKVQEVLSAYVEHSLNKKLTNH